MKTQKVQEQVSKLRKIIGEGPYSFTGRANGTAERIHIRLGSVLDAVRIAEAALKKLEADPVRFAPQMDNLRGAVHDIFVVGRVLGKDCDKLELALHDVERTKDEPGFPPGHEQ